jgi:hypothetical protein
MEKQFYKFRITEVHEYYAWVPAPNAEVAAAILNDGDDPEIEIASIRRYITREDHLGPATLRDHQETLAMHAYLEAQKTANAIIEESRRPRSNIIPFRPL